MSSAASNSIKLAKFSRVTISYASVSTTSPLQVKQSCKHATSLYLANPVNGLIILPL